MNIEQLRELLPNFVIERGIRNRINLNVPGISNQISEYLSTIISKIDDYVLFNDNYKMVDEFLKLNDFTFDIFNGYSKIIDEMDIIRICIIRYRYYIDDNDREIDGFYTPNELIICIRKLLDLESLNKPLICSKK